MPGATIRQQIITALDTRLKTILKVNDYNTDAGRKVFEYRETEIDPCDMPAIIYRDIDSKFIESFSFQRHKLRVNIDALVVGETAPADVRKLIADIIMAIGTDLTWGGLAEDTIPETEQIDVEHDSRRVAGAQISFTIQYRTGIFNPYTQG